MCSAARIAAAVAVDEDVLLDAATDEISNGACGLWVHVPAVVREVPLRKKAKIDPCFHS